MDDVTMDDVIEGDRPADGYIRPAANNVRHTIHYFFLSILDGRLLPFSFRASPEVKVAQQ
jgi:hypothetical protein